MDPQEKEEPAPRRRRRSRRHRRSRQKLDPRVRVAMVAFGLVGVFVIVTGLWRMNAEPGLADVTAKSSDPITLSVTRPGPGSNASMAPDGSTPDGLPSLPRHDPSLPPETAHSIITGATDNGAVQRCVIDGTVLYVAPEDCRAGAASRTPPSLPSPDDTAAGFAGSPATVR